MRITEAPTVIPQQCFLSRVELEDAIDMWFEGDPDGILREVYGWPMENWCFEGVTNFNSLFSRFRIGDLALTFDEPLGRWNTSQVTDLGGMFEGATQFNQDLGNWDTSLNQNLSTTFGGAENFNGNISSWSTVAVTEMRGTFYNAFSFNQDISSWEVSNVVTMRSMFLQATSFNQDLSAWRPTSAISLNSMFFGATSYNQSLCQWGGAFQRRSGDAEDMFVGTSCPINNREIHLGAPIPTPLCEVCDPLFDTLCKLMDDCSVLYAEDAPQAAAFDWLRNSNVDLFSLKKIVQRFALAVLYFATGGETWTNQNFWLTPIDECLWASSGTGFPCDLDRVLLSIELENFGLLGELPSEIRLLTDLTTFNVRRNTLFGEIPSELGSLVSLEELELDKNSFVGELPSELGQLTNLSILRIDENDMSGSVPAEVCAIADTTRIFLDCLEHPSDCESFLTCCSVDAPCR